MIDTQRGDEIVPGQEPEIAPGLRGYTMEVDGAIYIPLVFADSPGNDALARFLDELEASRKTVKFPTVINGRLADYLAARGYRLTEEWAEQFGEYAEVWVKP